ncbi:MAG: hypothetical protein H6819_06865 [Phycisphaerales bacterium]|nr:hypothetical protein [Phycisphaerales bacterium]MCB9855302.1 hypothetical protein [Phycisphaerales bacterium]MCB9862895.1 hypothetical protein [Phycisphaerales bacterium]
MLDEKTRQMLDIAMLLSAEELDEIRGTGAACSTAVVDSLPEDGSPPTTSTDEEVIEIRIQNDSVTDPSGLTVGERERLRTRESKVSTACVGRPREGHQWWPIGTELVGRIDGETLTATVVENSRVKSGRSILITSGSAKGTLCITPTRAAIEATEAYRQSRNLGRAGGVTNGWTFWKASP